MRFGSGLIGKTLALTLLAGVGLGMTSPAEAGDWDWLWDLFNNWNRDPVQVPEPATLALFATGAAAVALLRRRRK